MTTTPAALCYTPEEAADLLKLSPDDVLALVAQGHLPAAVGGSHVRISTSALDAYLHGVGPRVGWRTLPRGARWALAAALCVGIIAEGPRVLAEIGAPGNDSTGIPYDGFLERNGTPVAGGVSVRASVFDTDAAGAPVVYEETQDVTAAAGRFAMIIGTGTRTAGSATAFAGAVGTQNALFLGLAVKATGDADYVPLTGMQRLGSAMYALRAAPGHAFHADTFHTNGLGAGQLYLDGARIEANGTLQVGTGAAAGMGVVDVQFGGTVTAPNVTASGTLTAAAANVTGNVSAGGLHATQASAPTPSDLNTLWRNNLPKAWVNFTGTGVVQAAYNVSSVTRNGVGDYTIHFATALADANYAAMLTAQRNNVNSDFRATPFTTAPATTTTFRIQTGPTSVYSLEDAAVVHAVFFGN